jgi:hypothetical protein
MLFVIMRSISVFVFLDYCVSWMYDCSDMSIYLVLASHDFNHFIPTEQGWIQQLEHIHDLRKLVNDRMLNK